MKEITDNYNNNNWGVNNYNYNNKDRILVQFQFIVPIEIS